MSRLPLVLLVSLLLATPVAASAATPHNVILMIGDGCGFNHIAAGEAYRDGAAGRDILDSLAVRLAMSTYPAGGGYDPVAAWADADRVDHHVTDSAAAITAMTTGVKTRNGRLAVGPDGAPLTTLAAAMAAAGKAMGVVTTVPFAHATPAGVCVADPDRNDYEGIARAMLLDSAVDVIIGAGHPWYDDSGRRRTRPGWRYVGGEDTWRAVLAGAGADADGDGTPDPWTVVETRAQFQALASGPAPARLLGVPRVHETLQAQRDGDRQAAAFAVARNDDVPTLAEISLAALNVLDADPDGFFVMIEGGAADWASHDGRPGRLVEEVVDFLDAVHAVTAWIATHGGWDETLLIVTADHETGRLTGEPTGGPADWPPVTGCGVGCMPALVLHTGEHTNQLVPFLAQGLCSAEFVTLATGHDPVRGAYLDNTALGATLQRLARVVTTGRGAP